MKTNNINNEKYNKRRNDIMSKEKLSKSEICGYCGSKIMWDVEDDNFEPSEEDK